MRKSFPARASAQGWTLGPLALLCLSAPPALADHPNDAGVVTITASTPTSLPTQVPATMAGITARQIEETVNASDSEDALKYLPSLLVRKRYIGDYNHAILSSRASGTGNSARSAVYADGILLSNYLGNGVGGLSFPPRWGMVTPDEIERVDVMYGPFSAAYPGNSVGAVVEYTTRMPTRFEAHGKAGYVSQPFELYGTSATYRAWQASASAGNRAGDWSWWFNMNRTDSEGQPLTFATRLVSAGTPGSAGTPVTGAVLARNSASAPWYLLGSGTQYQTRQDHFKAKLAYDLSPTLRATYTLGVWQNQAQGNAASYLRDASGQPVTSGVVNINGSSFAALTGADLPLTRESLTHVSHGLTVKRHTQGEFDWELAASQYRYAQDLKRQNAASNPPPAAFAGGAGTVADGHGSGWTTLAAKGMLVTGPKVGTRVLPSDQWNWFDPDVIAWLVKKGLPREFVRDLQDLRRVVEPAAVRLAAQRADAQDLAAIESAYAGMKHAVEQGGDDYITHDLRFHQSLLRASRNRMLAQMSEVLSALLRTSFEISTRKDNGPASSLSMHREVLDAVSARQPERAEQVILRLIDSARQDIDDVLSSPRPARSRQAPAAALAS